MSVILCKFAYFLTKIVNNMRFLCANDSVSGKPSSGNAAVQFVTFLNEIYNEL